MTTPRLDTFRALVARSPDDPRARFGLANELLKAGLHAEAAEHLRTYLGSHDDEGNGWSRLAEALDATGDADGAREALRRGIEASRRHGHPGMANELEGRLEELNDR